MQAGFGSLSPQTVMRQLLPAVTLLMCGVQTVFGAFFISLTSLIPSGARG